MSAGKSVVPSGSGGGSFVDIRSKAHCYRRVLLRDTCRIPLSSDCPHCFTQRMGRCHHTLWSPSDKRTGASYVEGGHTESR